MLTIYATSAMAGPSCDDLRLDLLTIEGKIQNSKLNECTENNNKYCRPKNATKGHDNNKYYHEVMDDYNKAMAALIIQQGIETIGKTVEGSHNYLAAMKESEVDEADDYLNLLELNLNKAKILDAAMTAVEGQDKALTSFWHKYPSAEEKFDASDSYETFLKKLETSCNVLSSTLGVQSIDIQDEKLCKALPRQQYNKDAVDYNADNELLKTLHGYAIAEMRERPNLQQNPEDYYKKQSEKLQIIDNETLDENKKIKKLSPAEFESIHFGEKGKLKKLKDQISKYNKKDDKGKEIGKTEANAKEIFHTAKSLDQISVQYNISNEDQNLTPTKEFFQKTFSKPLANMDVDLTDTLVSDIWKNNLEIQANKIENEIKISNKSMEIFAEKIIEDIPEADQKLCDPKLSDVECVKELCGIINNELPENGCKNQSINSSARNRSFFLENFSKPIDDNKSQSKINSLNKFSEIMTDVKSCYKKPLLDEKKSCLIKQRELLEVNVGQSNITTLKEKVKKAKTNMANYNQGEPFKTYKLKKSLALNALSATGCNDDQNFNTIAYSCKKDLLSTQDQQVLTLTGDLANIVIGLEDHQILSAKGNSLSETDKQQLDSYRESYVDFCANPNNRIEEDYDPSLCEYFIADEQDRERYLAEQRRRQEDSKNRKVVKKSSASYKVKGQSGFGNFAKGFGQGMVASTPLLAMNWAQYDSTRSWKNQQLAEIAAREKAYDRMVEYNNWLKDNNYTGSSYYASNWGTNYYQDNYSYQSTFQGGNSDQIYNTLNNPYQFSFSGPMTTSDFTNTGTNTGNYDSGFSSNQSYEFSF